MPAELFTRFALATSVGAGTAVAGTGFLLFAPRGWVGRAAVIAGAVAVAVGWQRC